MAELYPWHYGKLKAERGHFMGDRFPIGTEVRWRVYDRDPSYIEVKLPDGHIYTEEPSLVETVEKEPNQRWAVY